MQREIAEAALVVASFLIFFTYHYWLLYLRGKGYALRREFHDYFSAGKVARSIFVEATATDEKEAILAVQQSRNAMTACSYLASISAVLATAGISIVFDDAKINRMRDLSNADMLLGRLEGNLLVPPSVIWCIAFGILYGAFVCFAQSMRLYVHLGFYVRAVPSRFNADVLTMVEAKDLAVRAGMAFTIGLRLFYLFIVVLLWSVGPSAFLLASLIMTTTLYHLDKFDHQTMASMGHEVRERTASRELAAASQAPDGAVVTPRVSSRRMQQSPFATEAAHNPLSMV